MKTKILGLLTLFALVFITSCTEEEAPVSPVATATPNEQTISSGAITAIQLSSSVSGTTYSWTVTQTGVSGAIAGTGSLIAQTLTTVGSVAGTATYTITPMANGVSGKSITVTITVNPVIAKVTFNTDIKPIMIASCTPCHVTGGSNPNKFDNYTTAKNKITVILDRVQREPTAAGFMPKGGTKLSTEKIALLKKWVEDGLIEN